MPGPIRCRLPRLPAFSIMAALTVASAAAPAAHASPHVLFGAFVKRTYASGSPRQQLLTLEDAIGRRVALDHVGFDDWSDRFPLRRMKRDLRHGRRPLVEWTQAPSAQILSGSEDRRTPAPRSSRARRPAASAWRRAASAACPAASFSSSPARWTAS